MRSDAESTQLTPLGTPPLDGQPPADDASLDHFYFAWNTPEGPILADALVAPFEDFDLATSPALASLPDPRKSLQEMISCKLA